VTPILIPFLLSQVIQPIYLTRYTIGGSVAWYIILAIGTRYLPGSDYLKYFAFVTLAVGSAIVLNAFFSRFPLKEPWRTAVEAVEERAMPRDSVLFYKGFNVDPFGYYSKREDLIKERFPEAGGIVDDASILTLKGVASERKRIWLVFSLAASSDEQRIVDALSESHELSYYRSLACARGDDCIEVYLFVAQGVSDT
jgi:hypothetical protein